MKITIKNESKSSEIKYPCLMISKDESEIVLFTKRGCGIAVASPFRLGEYLEGWAKDPDNWLPFTGTIELSND